MFPRYVLFLQAQFCSFLKRRNHFSWYRTLQTLYQQCLDDLTAKTNTSSNDTIANVSAAVLANITRVSAVEFNETAGLAPLVDDCEPPYSYVDPLVLPTLWRVLYWSCQFLSWLLLPLMQSYAMAGEFSVGGKLLSSLKRNAIYYGTYLLIFGILLIYLAAKPEVHLTWWVSTNLIPVCSIQTRFPIKLCVHLRKKDNGHRKPVELLTTTNQSINQSIETTNNQWTRYQSINQSISWKCF